MLCFDGERVGSPPFESLARQKHCYYEQGAGRDRSALGYCCTCTDTKNLNSNCVVCEMSIRTVVPPVFNILGSDIYMALISVIAKKGAWALE